MAKMASKKAASKKVTNIEMKQLNAPTEKELAARIKEITKDGGEYIEGG